MRSQTRIKTKFHESEYVAHSHHRREVMRGRTVSGWMEACGKGANRIKYIFLLDTFVSGALRPLRTQKAARIRRPLKTERTHTNEHEHADTLLNVLFIHNLNQIQTIYDSIVRCICIHVHSRMVRARCRALPLPTSLQTSLSNVRCSNFQGANT